MVELVYMLQQVSGYPGVTQSMVAQDHITSHSVLAATHTTTQPQLLYHSPILIHAVAGGNQGAGAFMPY